MDTDEIVQKNEEQDVLSAHIYLGTALDLPH